MCLSRDFLYVMHIIYSVIVCVMNFCSRIIADSLSILSINKAVCEWFCFNLPVCSGCLTGAPQKARRRAVIPAGVRRGGSACGDGRSHRKSGLAPIDRGQAAQIIYKVVYELLGCMKGLHPFHMKSAAATCAARGAEACRRQWRMQAEAGNRKERNSRDYASSPEGCKPLPISFGVCPQGAREMMFFRFAYRCKDASADLHRQSVDNTLSTD